MRRPAKQKRREITAFSNDRRRKSRSHKKRLNGGLHVRLNKRKKLQKLRNAGEQQLRPRRNVCRQKK
jgi:hypothetical protein